MNRKIAKSVFYAMFLLAMVLPVVALAQFGQSTYGNIPQGRQVTLEDIKRAITNVANFMIYAGVAIAIIMIIWGGIKYMTAGGDDSKVGEAKKRILYGLLGAVIIIGVGAIIRTIQALVTTGGGLF